MRLKKRIRKVGKKIGKGGKKIGKAGKKVGKFVKKHALSAVIFPLIPLLAVMRKILREKGMSVSGLSDYEVIKQFYNKVVVPSKHGQMEGYMEFPEHLDLESAINGDYAESDNLIADVGASVVTAIISYIKNIKKRKEQGEKLSKADEAILEKTETTITNVEQQAITQAKEQTRYKAFVPLIIVAGVLLILLIRK